MPKPVFNPTDVTAFRFAPATESTDINKYPYAPEQSDVPYDETTPEFGEATGEYEAAEYNRFPYYFDYPEVPLTKFGDPRAYYGRPTNAVRRAMESMYDEGEE